MKTYIAAFGSQPGQTCTQVFKGSMPHCFRHQASFIVVLDSDTGEFTRYKDRYALRQGDVLTNEQVNVRLEQYMACRAEFEDNGPGILSRFTRLQ